MQIHCRVVIRRNKKKRKGRANGASRVVGRNVFFETFALPHQGSLQDDPPFLVTLAVLCGELVDPAQFAVAVFAADVSHHVAAGEHDAVLDFAVL